MTDEEAQLLDNIMEARGMRRAHAKLYDDLSMYCYVYKDAALRKDAPMVVAKEIALSAAIAKAAQWEPAA